MGTWKRCPKTFFYLKTSRDAKMDKRAESFDRVYVDPVDMILVRTMPWHFYEPDQRAVSVLRWLIQDVDAALRSDDLTEEQADFFEAWANRVLDTMVDDPRNRVKKYALLADLDVDMQERDRLLDLIERLVTVAPPAATSLDHYKVPPTHEAVAGLLFTFGIASC